VDWLLSFPSKKTRGKKDEKMVMYLQIIIYEDGEESLTAVLVKEPREKRERDAPQRSGFEPFQ